MTTRPRITRATAAATGLILVLTACGGSSDSEAELTAVGGPSTTASEDDTDDTGSDDDDEAAVTTPSTDAAPTATDPTDDESTTVSTDSDEESEPTSTGDVGARPADLRPIRIELPIVPPIRVPDLSELDDIGTSIESGLGDRVATGLDVVSVECAPDSDELVYNGDSDGFLSVGANGSGTFSENIDGRLVEIAVNEDGSGTYETTGDGILRVEVGPDGAGSYYRNAGGTSIELQVNGDGVGTYDESSNATTGSVSTISLNGDGTGTYYRVDTASDDFAGAVTDINVTENGSGTYSYSSGGFSTRMSRSDEAVTYRRSGGDPYNVVDLIVNADGSGTYEDPAADIKITANAEGLITYTSGDDVVTFTSDIGILDPEVLVASPLPEFVIADRFPTLDKLPKLQAPCATIIRIDSTVLFDFDSAELRPEANEVLDDLVITLEESGRSIEINGHTDSIGTDEYNQDLSQRRADNVQSALIERGLTVPSESVGFGETMPVAPNETADGQDDPAGRQLNRRVEIVIRN